LLTRIAVLVSGGGTNLQALIDAQKNGILTNGGLSLVISDNPAAYALARASENSVPALAIRRKQPAGQADFETLLTQALQEHGIEMIVLAGFLYVLSGDFTARWPRRIINVHPSLIPSFCGRNLYGLKVHEAALKRGVKVTGATVHFVNEIIDGGEIILQKAVDVLPGDTPAILQNRVMREAEWKLLPAAAELVAREITLGRKEAAQI